MSIEVVITSAVEVIFQNGLGANGLMIPEHPGKNMTGFGGFALQQNTEWASYKALYDEFKVTGIICEFQPGSTAVSNLPAIQFVGLCDYDNEVGAGALTSMLSAVRYSTARLLSMDYEHQLVYRPPAGRSFTVWQSTLNNTARGSVYYFLFTSAGTTLALGNLVIKYIVQFRNSNG
jgi:hypothetical protein